MSDPRFPNVPIADGIPPVLRAFPAAPASVAPTSMLIVDSPAIGAFSQGPSQWGIFQGTTAVLVPDSFKDLDYRHEWRTANYPMEQGAFQSYNKVQTPFMVPVRMTVGGSDARRADFLTTLEGLADGVELYDVVTPDYVYTNVTIDAIGLHRSAREGAKLLTVDIGLTEVRIASSAQFTKTASPSAAGVVNGGTVQPMPATPAQKNTVNTGAVTGSL